MDDSNEVVVNNDDDEEAEVEAPKRQRKIRRNVDRGSRTKQSSTIGAGDYEIPKRDLRTRSKKIDYSEETQTVEEQEDEVVPEEPQEEEEPSEEEEEVKPKRTVRRRATTTTKPKARTTRGGRRGAKSKKVDSDDDDVVVMDDDSDEEESSSSEEEGETTEELGADEGPTVFMDQDKDDVIELILACRVKKEEEEIQDDEEEGSEEKKTNSGEETIEYLCKYKNKSYLHCEWIPRYELDDDIQTRNKINRFNKQYDVKYFEGLEEYFNPEFTEVERIIDRGVWDDSEVYCVKWKGLTYSESTWEFENKIEDKEKIEQYKRINKLPTPEDRRIPARPAPHKFKKLEESPSFRDGNQLREYQLEGLNWLVFCWYQRRNSILADEMGLGKTVQTVATLEYLRAFEHIRGPFIVIAPLSTVEHWKREFENWTDMNVLVFHGNTQSREVMKNHEFFFKHPKTGNLIYHQKTYKFNVLITTYEIVMAESSYLSKIPWQYLVVDEGHRLKNHNSKLAQILKNFNAVHKLLLTGTPIQNNLTELFSLLQFLDPETFYDLDVFSEEYGNLGESGSEKLEGLHKLISPYILRRLKEDVEKSIPPKEEIVVEVVPTSIQKAYEQAIFKRNREFLMKGVSKSQNVPKLNNVLMELRKVCNHPFLISGAEENITRGMSDVEVNEALIKSSSKMILVDKLLRKLREGGHKVLIFSQMVLVLNILEDYMRYRNFTYVRLDGTIKGSIRQQAIDRFNDPNIDTFVFLVSTKAGGVGINLTSADTVIIYDSDWNPQNDLQAQARCHRIGQTKEVKIYRLLTKNTKEKEIFERASMKLGLDRAVLSSNNEFVQSTSKSSTQNKPALEKEEIELLLRHGAYSAFKIDDTEEQKLLMDEDIDTIMERTATIVRYDQAKPSESNGFSNFSKATFCFSEDMEWENLLPREKTASGLMKLLSEDSSLDTEEQKKEYLNDVKALVDIKIHEIEKFKYKPDDELATLLTQMMYARLLDEDHKQQAKAWLSILEQPRLRNGSTRNEESDQSDDDSKETVSKKKAGGWYKAERQRFQKSLLEVGWGKWGTIRENKLHAHTIEDIHSLAESFVSQLITMCDGENDVDFLKILLQSSTVPEDNDDLPSSSLKIELKNTPARAGDILKVHLPKDADLSTSSIEIIKIAQQEARVSKKKKAKSQASSSKSSGKNLCVRFYELKEKDKEGDVCELYAPGVGGEYFVRLNYNGLSKASKSFEVQGVHPVLEDKEWIEQAKRAVKTWVKKLKFNLRLTKILEAFTKLTTDNIPKVGIKAPTDWWDRECDRDLLVGFDLYGYGRFDEMKEDTSLCFKEKHEEHMKKAKSRKEKKDAGSWPTIAVVNKRANKLMELLVKEKDISILAELKSNENDNDDLAFEETEISEPKTIVDSWSKREKADIQRTLINFGLCPAESSGEPNYAKIISLANLRKTESAVKTYVTHLVKAAKILNNEEEEKDTKESKKKDSNKPTTDDLAPGTAKKLIQRIDIMNSLYTLVYPNWDEYKSKMKYLKPTGSGLPKWWKSEAHDKELIRGIKKHGFDFKKLFEDKEFKFGSKDSPREGLLLSRIEEIISLLRKIDVQGSPSKAKSAWNFTPKKKHVLLKSPPLKEKSAPKRKVKRQTTLDFKNTEDTSDPIEDSSDRDEDKMQDDDVKLSKSESSEPSSSQSDVPTIVEDVLKKKIPKKIPKKEESQPEASSSSSSGNGTPLKRKKEDHHEDEDHHTPRRGEYEPNDKKRKMGSSPADHKYSPSHHRENRDYRDRDDRRDSRDRESYRDDRRDSREYRRDRDGRDYHRR
ncbi:chromodomain helicase DNA binding protein [Naegleria gruberi]|uniref:Chromodomain helicase DNA binding protein n=1 Tax=Naegleria gruberi TaxID=5762 RepID=D2UX51_NAEGR|nr:chromodomain helicase DNA binding protein [Naegleria gruberi]EFC50563.1 chromodomain helicase DNA binding protein [Naegleria gruberi]|eukprot:XP_002683307.1 chromodomain helicase DNA binding protein [Naegleria gruberi strain NEG-M]